MSALVFVDSNVLIYSVDAEFYWIAGKKVPEARDQIRMEIRDLLAWEPVAIDGAVLEFGWKLQDRYQLSFWDALIVAAAKAAGCGYLLTEDLQDGQDLDGVKVLNPFLSEPASLGL
jgi:predicted nucleic acid-binding protein